MVYTVNTLAKLSGVSVRTLHFYDEIGLLKPAFVGDNHYRYYEEDQLLMLQQILFFRELDVSLNEIKTMLSSSDFDKVTSLMSHKQILEKKLNRTHELIKTIDKTILHLRGKNPMKDEELYYGFDSEKQKQHEKYLVDEGVVTQEFLDECNQKIKNWTDKEKNDFVLDMEKIYQKIIDAMRNNLDPASTEVQDLMKQHYIWLQRTWSPNKENYIGLRELYQTPEFKKFYDQRHPDLLEFFLKSMEIFAHNQLT